MNVNRRLRSCSQSMCARLKVESGELRGGGGRGRGRWSATNGLGEFGREGGKKERGGGGHEKVLCRGWTFPPVFIGKTTGSEDVMV